MGIRFHNISKQFDNTFVVEDLSLEINDGEFIVLLGPSGCGKTTTLRMLAGLETVTSGDILINGERINDVPTQHRDLAMVFQSYALYPHMTIAENIGYPLRVRKLDKQVSDDRVWQVAIEGSRPSRQRSEPPRRIGSPTKLINGLPRVLAAARSLAHEPGWRRRPPHEPCPGSRSNATARSLRCRS